MADSVDIEKILNDVGLVQNEALIYEALIKNGTLSILNLSRITKTPRSTVYRFCEDLVERGFLEWVIAHKSKQVRSIPPDRLNSIIEKRESELAEIKNSISKLKQFYVTLPKNDPKTEVRYYFGVSGMKQLIWNTLEAKDTIVGYSTWGREGIVGNKFEKQLIEEMNKRGNTDDVIVGRQGLTYLKQLYKHDSSEQPFQNVRFVKDVNIVGDVYIYNNIYAINNWSLENKEIVGIEIQNENIAKVQKSLFENIWKRAVPLADIINVKKIQN